MEATRETHKAIKEKVLNLHTALDVVTASPDVPCHKTYPGGNILICCVTAPLPMLRDKTKIRKRSTPASVPDQLGKGRVQTKKERVQGMCSTGTVQVGNWKLIQTGRSPSLGENQFYKPTLVHVHPSPDSLLSECHRSCLDQMHHPDRLSVSRAVTLPLKTRRQWRRTPRTP